jgi:hypothetical protein
MLLKILGRTKYDVLQTTRYLLEIPNLIEFYYLTM